MEKGQGYSARIILDSVGPNGARLTTFELRYPRFVHAELMTHRMLSRNSASSRAIPTAKLLDQVEKYPANPVWWGRNESGMQAREELEGGPLDTAQYEWRHARDEAVISTRNMLDAGLHKQISNRIVEPWMFITVLVTATEFSNMRGLRVDPDAQPELHWVMREAFMAYDASTPQVLKSGSWHLPLVTGYDEDDLRDVDFSASQLRAISVGRCARVSFTTHEGKRDPQADIALAMDRLLPSGHMSPFEHVARALTEREWEAYAITAARNWINRRVPMGNLWGWAQWRKDLTDEHDFSKIKAKRKTK